MSFSLRRSRRIAWTALLAVLFSAMSPTLAATVLTDRVAVGQILGIPAAQPDAHADHQHHGHDAAPAPQPDEPAHKAHDIHCSFCLSAGGTVSLVGASTTALAIALAFSLDARVPTPVFVVPSYPRYHSRAPPLPA